MASISKCPGKDCPLKDSCYRYTASTDPHWQSWIEPMFKDGECPDYWKLLPVKKTIKQFQSYKDVYYCASVNELFIRVNFDGNFILLTQKNSKITPEAMRDKYTTKLGEL